MTNNKKINVAVLNSHPIQYFGPLYKYINQQSDIAVTALYLSNFSLRTGNDRGFLRPVKWNVDIMSGYESKIIGKKFDTINPYGFWSLRSLAVWSELRSGKYDVLWLHGYNFAANLFAFAAAKSKGIPILFRGETHLGLERSWIRRKFRDFLVRHLLKQCDACLSIGAANRRYYEHLGISGSNIVHTPYSIDNERFMAQSCISNDKRNEIRKKIGVDDERPIIIFASKFEKRKRPDDLLGSLRILIDGGVRCHAVFAGSGEMESQLRAQVRNQDLQDHVHFTGFVNQDELPHLFAACDVFVLPAENEPWGLVVNEAMACGLPLVVASEVGCAPDLVRPTVNGNLFPAGEVEALASVLRPILIDEELRKEMSIESRKIISGWSFADTCEGVKTACGKVLNYKEGN